MKKILILNLTRLGDLIQTTPLAAGLKEADPTCEITLAVLSNFAQVTESLPNIDKVRSFEILRHDFKNPEKFSFLDAYKYLDGFVKELKAENFDTLVNLTHSPISGTMAMMLGIPDTRGVIWAADGSKEIHNKWMMYFSSVLTFRHLNTFNIVDIYQFGGGVRPKSRGLLINLKKPEEEAREFLKGLGVAEGERVIGIQAGSSMSERRWPPSRFAKTADLLAKKWNAKILFFGVASEKNLVDEVISKLDPSMNTVAINLAGKTSISQIVGVVKRLFLLVTNDTATMHIAGAAGTPIVALFLVHAFGAETGPYCENAVLLEPDISCFPCLHNSKCPHYECLGYIMPEHALEASKIAVALKEGKKADVDPAFFGQSYGMKERKVLVKRTLFDNEGYYDSRPVFKKVPTQHELLGRVYRHYFKKPETTGLTLETLRREIAEIYDAMPTREMASFLVDKIAVFKKLGEAAERGKNAVVKTRKYVKGGSMDAETMAVHVTEIETADYDLELLSLTHPELNPFIKLFAVGTGNLSGGPDAMLERKKALFEELKGSADEIEGLLAGLKPL